MGCGTWDVGSVLFKQSLKGYLVPLNIIYEFFRSHAPCNIRSYYMANSVSGQDESNPAL